MPDNRRPPSLFNLHPAVPALAAVQAQVRYEEGGSGTGQQLGIVVQLPSGEVVEVDDGGSSAGQVIDVDWRSVDDK